jgi:hypothetical protein
VVVRLAASRPCVSNGSACNPLIDKTTALRAAGGQACLLRLLLRNVATCHRQAVVAEPPRYHLAGLRIAAQAERTEVVVLVERPGMPQADGLWPGADDHSEEWVLAHAALVPHLATWALFQARSASGILTT